MRSSVTSSTLIVIKGNRHFHGNGQVRMIDIFSRSSRHGWIHIVYCQRISIETGIEKGIETRLDIGVALGTEIGIVPQVKEPTWTKC
jgi:hypothetical protein